MSVSVRRWRGAAVVLAGVTAIATLAACSSSAGGTTATVHVVAYSVPKPAYDALETAFQQTPAGKGVKFSASYGSSGSQSKAVASGQPADVVAFSLDPDMTRLVPKYVASGWDANSTKGIVTDSVVVFVVRKGNPKHITGWADLIKPGIKIVTPDPASSGSAKWNILAAYEQIIANGGTPAQAKQYLTSFFHNVVSKPSSGADATTVFTGGTGDVLISYEDEAIAARATGRSVDYVVPDTSILIENPVAVTAAAGTAAKAFLAFVESPAGQQIFASKGFRPVDQGVTVGNVVGANDPGNPFPAVPKLVTIAQLGGWSAVNDQFFDAKTGIVTTIENSTS
jgi:sulfate transport system substrate-binding protein